MTKNFFSNHKDLNKNIFKNNKMKDDVRKKLLEIAEFAIEKSKLNKKNILDIILTGSLASYNYDEKSDIDLHIVYDLSSVKDPEKKQIVKKYLDEKRKTLNSKYNFTIKNHKVEIYYQDFTEPHRSIGIYSISKNKWIKFPKKLNLSIDRFEIFKRSMETVNEIKKTIKENPRDYKSLELIFNKIMNMRKKSLKKERDIFSVENLTFKFLRKTGLLDSLSKYLSYLKSRELTIERITYA